MEKKNPFRKPGKKSAWAIGSKLFGAGSDEVGRHGCYEEEGGCEERQYLADSCYLHFEYLLETFRKTAETRSCPQPQARGLRVFSLRTVR